MIDYDIDEDDVPQGGKLAAATRIVYSQGGWPGSSETFEIDFLARTFNCEFKIVGDHDPDYAVPAILPCRFSDCEWEKVTAFLAEADIDGWEDHYSNPEVCDGTQWTFSLFEGKKETRRIVGSNAWPRIGWKAIAELTDFACGLAGFPPDASMVFHSDADEAEEE